jgi:energy-coupling factor transporter ATP-binding protein EcfA2
LPVRRAGKEAAVTTEAPAGSALLDALTRVRDCLDDVRLPLDVPGADDARATRLRLASQLDDYVLPRLRRLDAPMLAVVGGSTGAGKSTLVNTLVGTEVTRSGVLRPTTRSPVLLHHPDDASWFGPDRILPGLARTDGSTERPGTLGLVPHAAVPQGIALLDAPDVDSVVTTNRELSRQLLDAADMWIFVTSAARYADAVPWDLLHEAAERGVALAVVLDRVAPEAAEEVRTHLATMLEDNDLGWAPLFVVAESPVRAGLLPPDAVAPLRDWLHGLALDARSRDEMVRFTLTGAVKAAVGGVRRLLTAVDTQERSAIELRRAAAAAYDEAGRDVDEALRDGTLLRGEVLARWQELVGTGELLRALESRLGWLRDRITAAVSGRPPAGTELTAALETGVEALVHAAAARAAERTADAWSARPAGPPVLHASGGALARSSPELPSRTQAAVRDWQRGVLELVKEQAQGKRTTARVLSYGVNGAALVVMVAVFAHTGGLTGGEVVVAGGASAVGQKLLEALLGDQAVRDLAAQAREDLRRRVGELLDAERDRYDDAVPPLTDPEAVGRLREAITAAERTS